MAVDETAEDKRKQQKKRNVDYVVVMKLCEMQ